VTAGLVAGFINTVAGSGSAVSLPLLIFIGLPPTVANATNRIGILLQCAVGTETFRRRGVLDARGGCLLSVPASVGAALGAWVATDLPEDLLERVIGALMLVLLGVILIRPKQWLEGKTEGRSGTGVRNALVFFAIGFYGGFIQMGVGVFLLAGLVLGAGYDLVRANAVKVLIVLCFTVVALVPFALAGQVRWGPGLVLAAGNMVGAWAGAHLGVKLGPHFIRWVLVIVVAGSAVKFLLFAG
jgi:uncharacterized protein